ncbi:response regulator [Paenibacillus sp. OV219]|uniref:response regulator n=1 Tax=Paenibacillus sp. OV219 TaxID=1884377 RepID=UPI0008B86B72|nr:response regulator [Paenibacillus sp. OV219]SEO64624.1 Response regulator receiver domain-containing protein [Paenibacillus sp. OV219]
MSSTTTRTSPTSPLIALLYNEETGLYHSDLLTSFIQWKLADMPRVRTKFTVVAIEIDQTSELPALLHTSKLIASHLRNTDYLFATEQPLRYIAVLMHTGFLEAEYLFQRIYTDFQSSSHEQLTAGMTEVVYSTTTYEDILEATSVALTLARDKGPFQLRAVPVATLPDVSTIKVSIIEDSPIAQNILINMMQNLSLPHMEFQIRSFHDGASFAESDWHHSGHMHLIFLSDILPQRDGIEVLSDLRSMPNASKYIVIMLGSRNTEHMTIYSLEHGADYYIAKPFSIKLLEAKVKRLLERLK